MNFLANGLSLWFAAFFFMGSSALNAAEPFADFYQPTDIAVHPNGNLYVTDSGSHRVLILDPNGTLIGEFGRKGFAPGEFQRPCAVGFLSPDEILVGDNIIQKIQVFDAKGNYKRIFLQGEMGSGQVWVMPDGKVLVTNSDGHMFSFNIGDENPSPLRQYGKNGKLIAGFGENYEHEIPFVTQILNHGSAAFLGNRIAFARVAENKMEVFEGDQTNTYLYAPAFPVRTPDGKMKEVKQPDGSVSFQMVAETDSHCLDLEAIDGERLLMLRAKAPETEGAVPVELVIMSWKGELMKRLPGTYRAQSMAIGADRKTVYLMDENDEGWFLAKADLEH